MHGLADGAQVVVGQDHAGGGFDVRGKHHGGTLGTDGGGHFFGGAGFPCGLGVVADAAGLADEGFGGDVAHVKNLCPAVAEPAVANDQHFLTGGELAGDRLHAKRAAARHQRGGMGVIHLFQNG